MIERILIENFGIHRRLELVPSPGLNGVVGRNGVGKSTVLAALEALVTGKVPAGDVKEANVNQLAGAGERSAVSGTIVHGGRRMEVVRGFRKAATTLVVDGGPALAGESKVNARLAEAFGPAMALMPDYTFVKQAAIYAFLDATNAGRARALSQLFGTAQAERCWDLAGKKLATILVPSRSVALDDARRRRADAAGRLASLRAARAAFADLKAYDRAADPDAAAVARFDAHRRAVADRDRLAADRDDLVASHRRAAKLAAAAVAELEGLECEAGAVDVDAAKVALATWKARRRHAAAVAALEARRLKLEGEFAAHPKPEPHAHHIPADDESRRRLIDEVTRNLANDREFLATFDGTGALVCPTCRTPTESLAGLVAAVRARVPAYEEHLRTFRAALAADVAYESARADWKRWRAAYKERLAQYDRDRAALDDDDDDPAPGRTEDELRADVARHAAVATAVAAARDALAAATRIRDERAGRLAELDARLAAAESAAADGAVDERDASDAARRLRATEARLLERSRLLGEVAQVKATLADLDASVAVLEAEAAESARLVKVAARLGAIRDVLHRDNLPRRVALGYLGLVEDGVNRLLGRFDAPFRVAAADDLSFTAHFHAGAAAGAVHPAHRLSFGQKVLLALAFRVEVNSLFASDLGLLCLDEPTQFLDEENVDCLEPALRALRELAAERGLQCFLVTHERKLGRLFDAVVSLPDHDRGDHD